LLSARGRPAGESQEVQHEQVDQWQQHQQGEPAGKTGLGIFQNGTIITAIQINMNINCPAPNCIADGSISFSLRLLAILS